MINILMLLFNDGGNSKTNRDANSCHESIHGALVW